jgi:hypothetical protein
MRVVQAGLSAFVGLEVVQHRWRVEGLTAFEVDLATTIELTGELQPLEVKTREEGDQSQGRLGPRKPIVLFGVRCGS